MEAPTDRPSGGSDLETVAEAEGGGSVRLVRGAEVGRYVILDRLGAGAMGEVFAAYDPALDRKVAIKFLLGGQGTASAAARLQREAQSLAKLSHPQVVAVHDVGTHADALFVAMEFVDGGTLRDWLEPERPWRDVLAMFVQAAHGLAAAHDAGVVHRDFKPDNVMVDGRGRARVMDFGLARADADAERSRSGAPAELRTQPEDEASHGSATDGRDEPGGSGDAGGTEPGSAQDHEAGMWRTRAGARLGTPAYMSPEQHLGEVAGPQADQFSFCVALWEALYGERPFRAATLMALSMAVIDGKRQPPPTTTAVPSKIARALERGLAREPTERHRDVPALITALERAAARRSRVGVVAGGVILTGAALAWGASSQRVAPCEGVAAAADTAWPASLRAQVDASLRGIGTPYAAATADRVTERLDAWTTDWRDAKRDACEDTKVRHEQSGELLDLRMSCLGRRLDAFEAATTVLADADATVAEHAVELVDNIPDVARCSDADALRAAVAPPEDAAVAKRVETMARALDRVSALDAAGRHLEARDEAERVAQRFDDIPYAPARARLDYRRALSDFRLDDPAGTERMRRTIATAIEVGDDALAADALAALARFEGHDRHRLEAGRVLAAQALSFARRVSTGTSPEATARIATAHNAVGVVELGAGEYEAAIPSYQAAIEIVGATTPASAVHHAGLGLAYMRFGKLDRAEHELQSAVRMDEARLGPDHPRVTNGLINLGLVYRRQARFPEALAALERSLVICDGAYGPDNRHSASVLNSLGAVHFQMNAPDRAAEAWRRVLETYERLGEADGVLIATVLANLAAAEQSLGHLDESRRLGTRALELRERDLPPDHPDISASLYNLALIDLEMGDLDTAEDRFKRSHAMLLAKVGPDHVEVGHSHRSLGDVARLKGSCEEAVAHYDETIRVLTKSQGPDSPWLPYSYGGRVLCDVAAGARPDKAMIDQLLAIVAADGSYAGHELGDVEYAAASGRKSLGDERWVAHARRAQELFADAGAKRARELAAVNDMLGPTSPP